MELKIGNKVYTVEFSVGASLCADCVEKTTSFMMATINAEGKSAVKSIISNMTELPQTALAMLYGGLQKHHGRRGDNTVTSLDDAEDLLMEYILENKDKDNGNYFDLVGLFIGQMELDGFFDMIGLTKLIQMGTKTVKPKKTPQDHKKKATQSEKVTEK